MIISLGRSVMHTAIVDQNRCMTWIRYPDICEELYATRHFYQQGLSNGSGTLIFVQIFMPTYETNITSSVCKLISTNLKLINSIHLHDNVYTTKILFYIY